MGNPAEDRAKASQLPEGDVIRILLEQHARIQELFKDVETATGEHKKHAFDELRALLAVHETAEEMVLRPVSNDTAGDQVTEARNSEEAKANQVLKKLEEMDVSSPDFERQLTDFQKAVLEHAENEESQEFPTVLANIGEDKRASMGSRIRKAEKVAPTHPHPSTAGSTGAQFAVGPFASLIDRTRDAIGSSS